MNTEEKLKEIFVTTFNTQSDKITLQTRQNEFENWDSLGIVTGKQIGRAHV